MLELTVHRESFVGIASAKTLLGDPVGIQGVQFSPGIY